MEQKYYLGTVILAALLLGIWGASVAGWFRLPDLMLYDGLVRSAPEQELASKKILLIEATPEEVFSKNSDWLSLNKRLQAQGAEQIVYTFVPRNVSRDFFGHAQRAPNICFGRRLEPDPDKTGQFRLKPLPEAARGLDLDFGASVISDPDYGVYRYQRTHVKIQQKRFPTLVHVAAKKLLKRRLIPKDRFLVNFNGKSKRLARISLKKALSDQLIPELVEDKSVVIGFTGSAYPPGLATPISHNNLGLDRLTYQGLALDTLISDKTIRDPGVWVDLACIAAVGLIGLVVYQIMPTFFALWFTGICLVFYLVASWIVFSFLLIWLPVFEIIVSQCLVFGVILRRRQLLDQSLLEALFSRISERIKAYIIPEDFITTSQHWHHITSMVSQTLNLSRSIFLEKVEKDHRVREIAATNCSLQDIQERRRDFERSPYTTALSENGPIQVEKYLVPLDAEEVQYLVPLYFAGQVLGFWALGIYPRELDTFNNFESMVYDYSQQIAEMLYQQQKWREEQRRENSPFVRYVQLRGGKTLPQSLQETYTLVEKKLMLFESVLQGLKTAIIVYDLFGRVVEINPEMEQILRDMDVKPFEFTAAELAGRLCQTGETEIRRQINQVVTAQETITMPIITSAEMEKDYTVSIGTAKILARAASRSCP